jgi:hypothetical protein
MEQVVKTLEEALLISKGRKIFTKEILEDLNIPNGP